MVPKIDRLLTPDEVAVKLTKPVTWVRHRRRLGCLPAINVGTERRPEWRYEESDINDYIRANKIAAVAPHPEKEAPGR